MKNNILKAFLLATVFMLTFFDCWGQAPLPQGTINIDRSTPFNPTDFMVYKDSDFRIVEQDERSLALAQVELGKVELFRTGKWERGDKRLKRLKKAGHIRLDAKVFEVLWNNKSLIPDKWKEGTTYNKMTFMTFIHFDGTIMVDSAGDRCVISLYYNGKEWLWYHKRLDDKWSNIDRSAVMQQN